MIKAQDDYLVLLAQSGDAEALNLLCQRYHAHLVSFAKSQCGDLDIAQEAAQEVLLNVAGKIRQLKDPRCFKSWVFRSVKWQLVSIIRHEQSHDKKELGLAAIHEQSSNEEMNESGTSVMSLVNMLPTIERDVIYLFYQAEMSINEISITLDVPEGTVKSRLNRARNQLKEQLEKQE